MAIKNYDKAGRKKTDMIWNILSQFPHQRYFHSVVQPTNMFYLMLKQEEQHQNQVKASSLILSKYTRKREMLL